MSNLSDQFQPLVAAIVARSQQILDAPNLSTADFTALMHSVGGLYRALQPSQVTAVNVSSLVTPLGFSAVAVVGKPFLVTVDGAVLASTSWVWSMEQRSLLAQNGYSFPEGAAVELYTLWHGDELPQPVAML